MTPIPRLLPLILMTCSPPTASWANPHKLVQLTTCNTCLQGGPRAHNFARNANRNKLTLHTTLLVYTTNLIQPLYGFLGWKKDLGDFYYEHAISEVVISSEFRPKSAGEHYHKVNLTLLLSQPYYGFFSLKLKQKPISQRD